jgi:hypothetical protein
MERLLGEGRTILVASHDPIVSGWPLAGGKVEMRDGKVVTATGAGE